MPRRGHKGVSAQLLAFGQYVGRRDDGSLLTKRSVAILAITTHVPCNSPSHISQPAADSGSVNVGLVRYIVDRLVCIVTDLLDLGGPRRYWTSYISREEKRLDRLALGLLTHVVCRRLRRRRSSYSCYLRTQVRQKL